MNYFIRLAQEVGYFQFFYRYTIRRFYKLMKRDQELILLNQVKMILPWSSKFGTELFLKERRLDWGSEEILLKFLDSEKSFIDIGANIGYYSLLAAPFSHQVYAFEPDPRVMPILRKNLAQFSNTQIFAEAVYSEGGKMALNLTTAPEFSSLVRHYSQEKQILIPVTTLDRFSAEHPDLKVSALKIDAEGADFNIILGGRELLQRDQPLVLLEAYPDQHLLRWTEEINFSVFAFVKPKAANLSRAVPQLLQIKTPPMQQRTKMIFLVPQRLHQQFVAFVREGQSKSKA